jgi:biotin carboxyl carrier protein
VTSPARLRVTIEAVPLVIRPGETEIVAFPPAGRGEIVTPLAVDAADRAEGRRAWEVVVDGWRFEVVTEPASRAELRDRAARAAAEHHPSAGVTLRAQIPGRVARLWVAEGEKVERGQRLLAIEAMKMENEIRSPQAGVVVRINVEVGQRLDHHEELLTLE